MVNKYWSLMHAPCTNHARSESLFSSSNLLWLMTNRLKLEGNRKVHSKSRSCPTKRNRRQERFRWCCDGRCWLNLVLGVASVNTSNLKYDLWSDNNNGFLPRLLTKRQPGNNPCPLCVEQLMSAFNQGYLQWEQPVTTKLYLALLWQKVLTWS